MSIVIDDKKIIDINISNKNVQKIVDIPTNKIIFEKTKPSTTQYFYIEDLSGADNTIILRKSYTGAPTVTLEYSKDETNWSVWGQTANDDNLTLSLQANSKIYFRGTNNVFANSDQYNYFRCTGKFGVGGDVTTLIEPSGNVLDLSGDTIKLRDDAEQTLMNSKINTAKASILQMRNELLLESQQIQNALTSDDLVAANEILQ